MMTAGSVMHRYMLEKRHHGVAPACSQSLCRAIGQGCSESKRRMKQKRSNIREHRILGFPKLFGHGIIFFMSIQLTC